MKTYSSLSLIACVCRKIHDHPKVYRVCDCFILAIRRLEENCLFDRFLDGFVLAVEYGIMRLCITIS